MIFSFPSEEGRNKQQEKLRNISHDRKIMKAKAVLDWVCNSLDDHWKDK